MDSNFSLTRVLSSNNEAKIKYYVNRHIQRLYGRFGPNVFNTDKYKQVLLARKAILTNIKLNNKYNRNLPERLLGGYSIEIDDINVRHYTRFLLKKQTNKAIESYFSADDYYEYLHDRIDLVNKLLNTDKNSITSLELDTKFYSALNTINTDANIILDVVPNEKEFIQILSHELSHLKFLAETVSKVSITGVDTHLSDIGQLIEAKVDLFSLTLPIARNYKLTTLDIYNYINDIYLKVYNKSLPEIESVRASVLLADINGKLGK